MNDYKKDWKKFANWQTPSSVILDSIFYENINKNNKIIDFWCWWGKVEFELQEKWYEIIWFDINKNEIGRAKKFMKETNKIYNNKIKFDIENATNLSYKDESFDIWIMQAFMTTIVDISDRKKVINEASRIIKKNWFLYLWVFWQTWENPKYKERYENHFPITKEKWTFIVTQDWTSNSNELYRVHHYTEEEIKDLLSEKFEIKIFKKTKFISYHWNEANWFIILAKNIK